MNETDDDVSQFMKLIIKDGIAGIYGISRKPEESNKELERRIKEAINEARR